MRRRAGSAREGSARWAGAATAGDAGGRSCPAGAGPRTGGCAAWCVAGPAGSRSSTRAPRRCRRRARGVARNSPGPVPAWMPGVGAAGDLGTLGGTWAAGNTHVAHPARPNRNQVGPSRRQPGGWTGPPVRHVPPPPGALARSVTTQVCAHGGHPRDGSPAQHRNGRRPTPVDGPVITSALG